MRRSYCLATVTDPAFLPGTEMLIASFLHHNSWFDGDIVILHDDLPAECRERLRQRTPVHFHAAGPELRGRLRALAAARPGMTSKLPIFLKFESHILPYTDVLYLDSDILCVGDAADLMAMPGALLCCPDQAYFGGLVRDRSTYVPREPPAQPGSGPAAFGRTFNAGMMLIRPQQLAAGLYDRLLQRITAETWEQVRSGHSDSIVLNTELEHDWIPVSERYNHLLSSRSARYRRVRGTLADAVFLHFLGRPKPWQPYDPSELDAERRLAFGLWQQYAAGAISERA